MEGAIAAVIAEQKLCHKTGKRVGGGWKQELRELPTSLDPYSRVRNRIDNNRFPGKIRQIRQSKFAWLSEHQLVPMPSGKSTGPIVVAAKPS